MLYYNEATLVYVGTKKASDFSPYEVKIEKTARVKEIKTFSLNYYTSAGENQRSMRLSKNIVVPKWMTDDIFDESGTRYELLYVTYNNIRYHVANVLKYYKSSIRMVLDIEELR